MLRIGEESEATNCKGVGKGAECQHSVLSGKAGNEASLLAREATIERTGKRSAIIPLGLARQESL